jgi:hypothetical protein
MGKGKRVPTEEELERENDALKLRRQGKTYDAIAAELGYANATGARRLVRRAIGRAVQDNVDDLRRLENDRLDQMQAGIYPLAVGGIPEAIDRVLKIQARRAALNGLDMPAQIEHTGPNGGSLVIEVLPSLLPKMADPEDQPTESDG